MDEDRMDEDWTDKDESSDDGYETVSDDENAEDDYEVIEDEETHIDEEQEKKEMEEIIAERERAEVAELEEDMREAEDVKRERAEEQGRPLKPDEDDYDDYESYISDYVDFVISEKVYQARKKQAQQAKQQHSHIATAIEQNPTVAKANLMLHVGPEDMAKLEKSQEYQTIIQDQLKKAQTAEALGDEKKAMEHKQRAQVYIDELEEMPLLDIYKQEGDRIHGASEDKICRDLCSLPPGKIKEKKSKIVNHLNSHSRVSSKDYSYCLAEPSGFLPLQDFEPRVMRVDHHGETAAQVNQTAKAHNMTVFEYLARKGLVHIELTGKEDEDGYKEHKKSRPQKKYSSRMFPKERRS